jgi:RHS repeat-associated protein
VGLGRHAYCLSRIRFRGGKASENHDKEAFVRDSIGTAFRRREPGPGEKRGRGSFRRFTLDSANSSRVPFSYPTGTSPTTAQLTDRFLWGPAVDQLLADETNIPSLTSPGTVDWTLGDNENTIRDIAQYNATTGTTTVVDHIDYNAFGQQLGQTDATAGIIFGYTGSFTDAATGNVLDTNRWYTPQTGTWMSRDPIGFAGGQANLSEYVGNSPTNATDPSGLKDPFYEDAQSQLAKLVADRSISAKEAALRLGIVDAALKSRIPFNPDDTAWRNPKDWNNPGSNMPYTFKSYPAPYGTNVAGTRNALRNMLSGQQPPKDSGVLPGTGCKKARELVTLMGQANFASKYGRLPAFNDFIQGNDPSAVMGSVQNVLKNPGPAGFGLGGLKPGDGVWLPNPDFQEGISSPGSEGSNMIYLGGPWFISTVILPGDNSQVISNLAGARERAGQGPDGPGIQRVYQPIVPSWIPK